MDKLQAIRELVDICGALSIECCERCENYPHSEEEATDHCKECFVKSDSDRSFEIAMEFGVGFSTARYMQRKFGSPWGPLDMPNGLLDEDDEDIEDDE